MLKVALNQYLYQKCCICQILQRNSLGACEKLGATVMIENGLCKISRNSKMLAVVAMIGKLYVLKVVADEYVIIGMDESSLKLWHYRFVT